MRPRRVVLYTWSHRVHGRRWARGLSERGLDIRVISHGGEKIPGIDTVVIPPRKRWGKLSYIATAGQATRAAADFEPDLVHGHYAAGFGYWAWRTAIRPRVISVWGSDVVDFPNDPIRHWLLRRILLSADAVTATSEFLARAVGPFLTGSHRLEVIPFGVSVPGSTSEIPSSGHFRVCFLKAHARKYGPDVLLHALAEVRRRGVEVTASLAGEGEWTPFLRQMSHQLGLDQAVVFTGFIDNASISEFIHRHHCMVMPSVMESESFGVAALEAAACGRPCIASRIGGVSEVIEDGHTGVLVPPQDVKALADAIVGLALNRRRCQEMGRAAYEFVKRHFTWEHSLDLMIDLYERLIHEKAAT